MVEAAIPILIPFFPPPAGSAPVNDQLDTNLLLSGLRQTQPAVAW